MAAGDVAVNITSNNARAGAKFDGVDDRITHGATDFSYQVDGNMTWSFWVNKRSGLNQFIFGKGSGGQFEYAMIFDSNSKLSFDMWDLAGNAHAGITSGTASNQNEWIYVTIVYVNDTSLQMFINGVDSGSDLTLANNPAQGTAEFVIGNRATDAGRWFKGTLSDLRIWDRDLTQTEITKVFNGGDVTKGLKHRYKLDTDYTDSAGDKDGTNTGTYFTIEDDSISSVISGQRVVASASGAYIQTGMKGGQIVSVAVTETA